MNQFSSRPGLLACCAPVVFILVFLPILLKGQQRLTLNDAVQEGLINNYRIQVAKNETKISSRNVNYGNAGFLPSVTAYGSIDKAYLDAKVEVVSGSTLDNRNAEATITQAGIRADWVLFDGARMFAEYEKLKVQWKISDLETRIMMENVVGNIILAYSDIIRQKELLDAYSQRLKLSNFRLSLARERLNSGLGSEQELLQSSVAYQGDSTAWLKQTAELKKTKVVLNQLIASDFQRDFITEDSISLVSIPDLDQLTRNSLENNNYLKMRIEELKAGQIEVKSLKSYRYPKLSVAGSYGYYENNTGAAFIKYNRYFGPQIGVNVGMKLFDGMKLNNSIQNAQLTIENKELLIKDIHQELVALILKTYYDYQSSLQSITLGREGVVLAKKNLDITLIAYQSGAVSSLQLRLAQDDLFNSTSNLVDACFEGKIKETELLNLSGMLIK